MVGERPHKVTLAVLKIDIQHAKAVPNDPEPMILIDGMKGFTKYKMHDTYMVQDSYQILL